MLLHASETWPLTTDDMTRLLRNDNSMVRWICGKKLRDRCSILDLTSRLNISSLPDVMRRNRLRWFGHVKRMDDSKW